MCAHVLGPHHDVVLFESDGRLGGHANTVKVDDPEAGELNVDTGFIVHNDRNYPNLVRLFDELGVSVRDTEMSFAVTDQDPNSRTLGFSYRATNLNTLFADRKNVVDPTMWRLLVDIARFYRHGRELLSMEDPPADLTIGDFVARHRYGKSFVDLHLLPMGSAIWSADPRSFLEFPALSLMRFYDNHGLLGIGKRPQWRTVVGGSAQYVAEIERRFPGEIRLNAPVESVSRGFDGGVEVTSGGATETFDEVILACHADQALEMIADASRQEKELLGAFTFEHNAATLHTDTSLLPPKPRAWAAWNCERRSDSGGATLSYDLTTLQGLPGSERYLVSLNSDRWIDDDKVIRRIGYSHPVFDTAALEAQPKLRALSGTDGLHFCGAWLGYGFHEDGAASALDVCEDLGISW